MPHSGNDCLNGELRLARTGKVELVEPVGEVGQHALLVELIEDLVEVRANAHPIAEGRLVTYEDQRIGVEIVRILERPDVQTAIAC